MNQGEMMHAAERLSELEAEIARLRAALLDIAALKRSQGDELGDAVRYARAALAAQEGSPAVIEEAAAEIDRLRDAAENALIAYGMGWDMEGVMEVLKAALAPPA